jgi:hypothetical protein
MYSNDPFVGYNDDLLLSRLPGLNNNNNSRSSNNNDSAKSKATKQNLKFKNLRKTREEKLRRRVV